MPVILMTVGYEGIETQTFWDLLATHNVQTLVDVRERPLSRKRGFSKSTLIHSARDLDITYIHLPELGCPSDIRTKYKEERDWNWYTEQFLDYLSYQESAVAELAERVNLERCCLLCFEADAAFCHRSFVAERVASYGDRKVQILHIRVPAKKVER
jgi:uncharacterized protein (DUF488 family)